MAGSGLESQVDPGSAGAARAWCMLWIHGKVRYSGGGVSLEGGRVLESEDLLDLRPKAVKSAKI